MIYPTCDGVLCGGRVDRSHRGGGLLVLAVVDAVSCDHAPRSVQGELVPLDVESGWTDGREGDLGSTQRNWYKRGRKGLEQ